MGATDVREAPPSAGETESAPIPHLMLRQLYTFGSLRNTGDGVEFSVKNRLADARLTAVKSVRFDGVEAPLDDLRVFPEGEEASPASRVSDQRPIDFPLRRSLRLEARRPPLSAGRHDVEVVFDCDPFGPLVLQVQDAVEAHRPESRPRIPRAADDYDAAIIAERQAFVAGFTGTRPQHLGRYSFDPHLAAGNCEHFVGAAQVPVGVAGPLLVHGEHVEGEVLVPLATSEGTLVASYNRGMRALNLSGGVTCTVVDDAMQRAPVFEFAGAREGRDFARWVRAHLAEVRAEAEATSHVAKLLEVETYLANRFVYLRFNYTTGDAAGQNMVSRATYAACCWILQRYPRVRRFYLESNLATDKKSSHVNILRTRGKRVTAEAVIRREVLVQRMRVEPEALVHHYHVANVGSFLAGATNNGLHAANAVTALFIATGQDVANVAESSAGIVYADLTPERDLYLSITLPSLIVATYGGGTGLATQRECLEMMGCRGKGKVNRLAEITAGVVLAGELSLAAAISALEWVSSHERYGRNR
jgi:hydroxymethylglutaryl-CoA reductase (NADPH)